MWIKSCGVMLFEKILLFISLRLESRISVKFLLIMQPDFKLCEDFKPPAVWAQPEGTNRHLFLIRPPSCNPSREMSLFCARVYYLLFDACVPLTQYVETRCLKGCYCRYIQRREDNHRSAPRCRNPLKGSFWIGFVLKHDKTVYHERSVYTY